MKKFLLVVLMLSLMTTSALAATDDFGEGMAMKFKRGIVNLFTGIIEVPAQIMKGYDKGFDHIENEAGSKVVGTVLGFFRGFSHAGGRMSWGALELFGFWAANPLDNEGIGIPLDAEYAWEEGTQYNYFDPSLEEGIKPIFRKLGRGLGNGLLGIAELPGQTMKGFDEGEPVKGVVKGVWYWFSRGVYGLGDIYTTLSPNPPDNLGVAFDTKWPWDTLSDQTDK